MSETSREAARSMTDSVEQLRARIMVQLQSRGESGSTCDEIEVVLNLRHQTASARIRELVLDDLIMDSGARRLTRSGRRAVVWTVALDGGFEPPLKWAGGKRWLLPRLRAIWAPHRHRRLVEPFVGGMAVALGLRPDRALLADTNPHLIKFYLRLRDPRPFTIRMENDSSVYYDHRKRFNELIAIPGEDVDRDAEIAELFYCLNRSGFNGLCRFNSSGEFNVPFGKYKTINYRRDFSEYSTQLSAWEIVRADFSTIVVDESDFVFCDPPYDGTFVDYSSGGFDWEEQERLACQFSDHPGPVVATNQATDRILELYRDLGYSVDVIEAPRRISSNGDRKPALEMIATRNILVDTTCNVDITVIADEDENADELENEVDEDEIADEDESENDNEGEDEMAFLPKGWGAQVANAEATIQRQNLRDGEYLLLHKMMFRKDTQNGPAVIIEHNIVQAKKIVENVDPLPEGSTWGYFMPEYGKAKVMLFPNTKAYVLGLLGIDEKRVIADLVAKGMTQEQAKASFAATLGDTIDSIADERMMARGMLIKGITFHTKTDEGADYIGMNWFPVQGENVFGSPTVVARRQKLDSESAANPTPSAGAVAGAPTSPPSGAALPPPPQSNLPPPPAAPDPLVALVAQGWKDYPGRPDCMYKDQTVKLKTDLIAGR